MRKFGRILYTIFLTVDHLSRAHSSSKRSSLIIQEKWDRVEVYTAAAKKICLWPERPWYVRYHIWEKSVWGWKVFEPLVYVFTCILEEMLPISYLKSNLLLTFLTKHISLNSFNVYGIKYITLTYYYYK